LVRSIVLKFWSLSQSDRREIMLRLGLISDDEIALPEGERYTLGFTRAYERKELEALEQAIDMRIPG